MDYPFNCQPFGGQCDWGVGTTAIQEFNPATLTTTIVGHLPVALRGVGAVVIPDGTLYVGGGQLDDYPTNGEAVNTWYKSDISTLSFTTIASDPAFFPYEEWTNGETSIEGTVTYNGAPVPGAIVGLKYGKNATADATYYAVTDSNGHYGPVYVSDHTWRVSAWKDGFAPAEDVTITVSG
ncbi:MAG TPA: carboxypeptidase-like regulatory domain-containing protein, partial [Armatimonadota bacterium]|nr:carboxypeptidase-like regulatory domain-containing protein [Armatimonadota bacterium]